MESLAQCVGGFGGICRAFSLEKGISPLVRTTKDLCKVMLVTGKLDRSHRRSKWTAHVYFGESNSVVECIYSATRYARDKVLIPEFDPIVLFTFASLGPPDPFRSSSRVMLLLLPRPLFVCVNCCFVSDFLSIPSSVRWDRVLFILVSHLPRRADSCRTWRPFTLRL